MDFDRRTGARLSNYESALQSVEILFFSRIGEHVMLREYGAGAIALLGRLVSAELLAAFRLLVAAAIDVWEPRFRVRRVLAKGSVDDIRMGKVGFAIEVDFRPNAHLGDFSVEGTRIFGVRFGRNGGVTI